MPTRETSSYEPQRIAAASGQRVTSPYPDLGGYTTHAQAPYGQRIDLYHATRLWESSLRLYPHLRTSSRDEVDATVNVGYPSAHACFVPEENPVEWKRLVNSDVVRRGLAFLLQFGHATGQQLCCALKMRPDNQTKYLKASQRFGLVARRSFRTPMVSGRLPYIYSLADGAALQRYLNEVGDDLRAGILAGARQPTFPSHHIRHNVLVTEATLRTIETNDRIVHVDGEHSALVRDLLGQQLIARKYNTMRADAVWWRDDGLRIVVELATSSNLEHIEPRIRSWADLLVSTPPQQASLVVVWLVAANDGHHKMIRRTQRIVQRIFTVDALTKLTDTPISPGEVSRVRRLFTIASWQDWYPSPFGVSEAGMGLVAGIFRDDHRWHTTELADSGSYPTPLPPIPTPTPHLGSPSWASELPLMHVRN